MKISKARTKSRQLGYTVELSEYDAEPPARAWLIDEAPDFINPELEAMALYLIFGHWCGGEFEVPRKMGPNTATAIAHDSITEMFCGPIEFYPKALPLGKGCLNVTTNLGQSGNHTLVGVPSSSWNGSVRSTNSIVVASNSDVFQLADDDARPLVALSLLFVETLNADEIRLIDSDLSDDQGRFNELRAILSQVRIGLSRAARDTN